jgi:hypothetical protein
MAESPVRCSQKSLCSGHETHQNKAQTEWSHVLGPSSLCFTSIRYLEVEIEFALEVADQV